MFLQFATVCPESLIRGRDQRGAALLVALVFMLIITVIGVSSMRSAILQERMAGNTHNLNVAFQAAEAAVRSAEAYLQGASIGPFNGSSGLYLQCDPGETGAACSVPDWGDPASTGWLARPGNLDIVANQPEYVIQQLPLVMDPTGSLAADSTENMIELYRVTARGFGTNTNTMVILQTLYRRD